MRILFLIRSLGRGGAEQQLVLLANGLSARGHEVHIATFYSVPGRAAELNSSIRVHDIAKKGRWDIFGFLVRYVTLCRQIEPEIVHSYMATANLVASVGRFFVESKVVWGMRTSKMPFHLYEHRVLSNSVEYLTRHLSRYADLIICNSQAGRNWFVSCGFPAEKTVTIPNGIDTKRLSPNESGTAFRSRFAIPASAHIVGFIGRLDPVKNIELLIDAFARSNPDTFDSYLLIVGDGSVAYEDELKRRAAACVLGNRVYFLPGSEIESAIQSFDIGVSSSMSEGFSNTIAEMMGARVPCVVTDVGDSALIVGETGVVVPNHSVDELNHGIQNLLGLDAAALADRGQAARSRIIELFNTDLLVTRTESLLESVLCEQTR